MTVTVSDPERISVLIIYATTHGQTAKIASRLKTILESNGERVETCDVGLGNGAQSVDYDAVVVAASIHRGHHQREMIDWVKANLDGLDSVPNAFLSVSLTAADDTDEARTAVRECIRSFVSETGWNPRRSEPVAGAIQYREYDVFTRVLMRLLMKHGGHPTDTSRDHEFTDWPELERLGVELASGFSERQLV